MENETCWDGADLKHVAGNVLLVDGRIKQRCTDCQVLLIDVPLTTAEEVGLGFLPESFVWESYDGEGRRWTTIPPP